VPSPNEGVRRLSPHEAFERVEHDAHLYVDVSSVPEFDQGHPTGAYNVPLREPGSEGPRDNAEFLRVMQACFADDAKLVLGCRTGQRSLDAARLLQSAGFRAVVEQRAGFSGARGVFGELIEPGWQAAGLPSATVAEAGHDYAALLTRALRRG
jgi:rhodanese-related sulfurtransferase